jgi:hypothetical protein
MAVLMTDPVLLPTSNYIMDRAQITRHLLTDQRDPMNRAPLTPDMLVPQVGWVGDASQMSAQCSAATQHHSSYYKL